ncbi:NADPH-dependent FMN reductase [Rubrobacter tropicus]|uniref:NADPH-dependent FMN reductase n=1 Tax=Rubrobacter tropicus TaxID=2653851 RepID=UPI001A9E1E93
MDIADHALPHLDEPVPPLAGQYTRPHTHKWAAKIAPFDAFVFVTPEYNHSIPGALKNAIDFLFAEWNDKVAGFVSYGVDGGIRAVEHLRLVMGELKVADVRHHVALSLADDFRDYTEFAPSPGQEENVAAMLDELLAWGSAPKRSRPSSPLRDPVPGKPGVTTSHREGRCTRRRSPRPSPCPVPRTRDSHGRPQTFPPVPAALAPISSSPRTRSISRPARRRRTTSSSRRRRRAPSRPSPPARLPVTSAPSRPSRRTTPHPRNLLTDMLGSLSACILPILSVQCHHDASGGHGRPAGDLEPLPQGGYAPVGST